ncbi:MAG: DUF1929 domain-containing protein [Planctomycetes bacterium]|nr:DUF1929 domain-containing protein [Planctomycetota bacterium]
MKIYFNNGAMFGRPHSLLRKLTAICTCAVAFICTQSTLAQALGEWQEPPPVDGDYTWPLAAFTGALMPDGKILVWQTDGETARLWDSSTGAFTCMPNFSTPLFCSGHASLANGSLLIAGGGYPSSGRKDTNVYCYGNCFLTFGGSPWQIKQDMNFARYYPTCTTLGDGSILVSAGKDASEQHVTFPEIYDPVADSWSTMDFADKQIPLYPFMFLLPDGRVFFAGPRKNTFVLDIDTGFWDPNPIVAEYFASKGTAAMYEPGKIIRIGGDTDGVTESAVELIDFNEATPAWSTASSMNQARYDHQAVLLADGKVLVIGGLAPGGAPLKLAELYDPAANTWTNMEVMTFNRYHHAIALLLPDGKVLSAGGNNCNGEPSDDCDFGGFPSTYCNAELFAPPYLFAGPTPVIGFAPTTISYGLDFTVSLSTTSPVGSSGIAKVSLIRPGAMTHNFDQNQRYVELDFTLGGIGHQNSIFITAPLNGNIAPPGYYMLFLISDDGVPAVAKFVQLQ